ncbi:MAG: hypothetical protein FD165_2065 [Gammaproteobacteria bacterium]|nr:MAG: hypothetical protein FD165_2065 [Gammaproteobacteria bacterium]TND01476.1 MAG: hypothetical protein FD120_2649 [Gammaproteobacteria bacterium]
MTCRGVVVVVALLVVAGSANAQDKFGVGIIAGEPTGITVKKWLDNRVAIDAAAAWSFSDNDSFQFHMDYLIHDYTVFHPKELKGRLPLYYGVGGRLKLRDNDNNKNKNNDDTLVGIRVPVGVAYLLPNDPFEFFAEIVPTLDIAPETDLDINAALGFRYYFN